MIPGGTRSIHTHNLDADEVSERVWVGSAPARGGLVAESGFTHVVLCAVQHQPPTSDYPGATVLHCPYEDDDSIMSVQTMTMVVLAARAVAEAHRNGGNVLVTCQAGVNRSALVAALALQMLGVEPWASVERIRAQRMNGCLSNECFLRVALGRNRAIGHYMGAA